jgi:hypothetical protein
MTENGKMEGHVVLGKFMAKMVFILKVHSREV